RKDGHELRRQHVEGRYIADHRSQQAEGSERGDPRRNRGAPGRETGQSRGDGIDQRRRLEERSHLLATENDHGTSRSLPVVLREASSSCAFAASASGSTCSIFTLRSPRSTAPSTAPARLRSSSRVIT